MVAARPTADRAHRRRRGGRHRRCRAPDRGCPGRAVGRRGRRVRVGLAVVGLRFGAATRWADGTPVLATTAWQLVAGGTVLTLAAAAVEGSPPAVEPTAVAGYAFTSVVATALAFVCWFAGLQRIRAGAVGVIGLLNPVAGVALGALVADERLAPQQLAGIALTLAGIAVATRPARRRGPAAPGPAMIFGGPTIGSPAMRRSES
ncbi:DMT family transporter [Aeromicrobium sp. Sec7.5]|uniref:DMT family transporter n=1 Tax=Aeromicrobium sp. Sec7.5 TaxID=3121276 RepID=UPI003FA5707D